MIKLYQYEISPFCTKVALILNAKGVPYEAVEVPLSKSQTVRRFSPTSKLPAIEHEGRFINDSTDIAWYLEEQFPDPVLIPKDDKLLAKCHIYDDWADESLNFYMMMLRWLPQNRERWSKELAKHDKGFWRWLITRFVAGRTLDILSKQGVARKSEKEVLRDIDRHMQALSADLENNEYLVGDALSLADISVFSQIRWMYENPEGQRLIQKYPALNAWREKIALETTRAP